MLSIEHSQLKENECTTLSILKDAFEVLADPLGSLGLGATEPKDNLTAQARAYAIKVLAEIFFELPASLPLRGVEDMVQAVRSIIEYIFRCYHSRDANFNLDLIWEGAVVAGPEDEE